MASAASAAKSAACRVRLLPRAIGDGGLTKVHPCEFVMCEKEFECELVLGRVRGGCKDDFRERNCAAEGKGNPTVRDGQRTYPSERKRPSSGTAGDEPPLSFLAE